MAEFINRIIDYFGNLCYYPGCLTRFALPEIEENYIHLLKKLDTDFIVIPDELMCCGAPVLNAGYEDEFNSHKSTLVSYFKKHGVTKIITSCPTCYNMLKKKYNYDAKHFTQLMFKKISRIKPVFAGQKITYHDPCHLGRYESVYEEPRQVLRAMGFEVLELRDNKEKSMCCGAGAGYRNVKPKVSSEIARLRNKQALETGATKFVTCCPMCYSHLKENAPKDLEVYEISELLMKAVE
jgi:heterodisulfide reductase subunit D